MGGQFSRTLGVVSVSVTVLLCWANGAFALPAGRAYEQVSPVFKGGFGALKIEAAGSDGEAVVFYSPGAFAGATSGPNLMDYFARRQGGSWRTTALMPPAPLVASLEFTDVAPSLTGVLVAGKPGSDLESPLPEISLMLHDPEAPDDVTGWEPPFGVVQAEDTVVEKGADPGFCHLLLHSTSPLLSEAGGAENQIYEFDRGCGGEPSGLAMVALDNQEKLINGGCGVDVGSEDYGFNGVDTYNAISSDGSEVFFTDCLSGVGSQASPHQLFARVAGSRTVEVSKPLAESCSEVPCPNAPGRGSAEFTGASEDGSRVFFVAPLKGAQPPLVPGDTDPSNNLYAASIGCPEEESECSAGERGVVGLADASKDPNSEDADVRGVVRISPDGRRAYFVAGGDLLSQAQSQALENEGRSRPRVGADNLYVYDSTSEVIAFVGDLCSGGELSGTAEDIDCPSATGHDELLWTSDRPEAQTAGPDGRFLVFSTYAQLTADDTNAAKDVYRYDAQTGTFTRISLGEDGYDANGNGGVRGSAIMPGHHGAGEEGAPVRSQYELDDRAVSEDGSTVVFVSAEPLSPAASNGLDNVYEWHEGSVSIVSSGSGAEPVEDVVVSPDGRSVFFDTVEGLVPADLDGAPDVYDARIERPGETPPPEPSGSKQCEEGCQGPLTNPAPLLIPGSVTQAPGGNLSPPVAKPKPRSKAVKSKKAKAGKCKKKGRKAPKAKCSRAAHRPSGRTLSASRHNRVPGGLA